MFNKICFFVVAVSIFFSGESFAKRSVSQEQRLEKKSLHIAKRKPERLAKKRPARSATKQKSLNTKKARIVQKRAPHVHIKEAALRKHRPVKKMVSKRGKKRVTQSAENNSNITCNVFTENKGKIVHNGKVKVNSHTSDTKGLSTVEIDGMVFKGKNVNVTKKENSSYIVDIDGVRKVIDKPLVVSKNTYSSSKTKKHNGHTTKNKSASTTHYSFITKDNKNIFITKGNKNLSPAFQKDMDKLNADMKKMTKKMNNDFEKDRKNFQKDMDDMDKEMKRIFG